MKTVEEISKKLSPEEIEQFGEELEGIRKEVLSSLGAKDADHIRKIELWSRYLEISGRFSLHFGLDPLTWFLGVGSLSLAKILDNMELGHNIMHGQYDWMNDPELNSQKYDWDIVSEKSQWILSHNYYHHTYTNVLGKDFDFGYSILRLSSEQEWRPIYLLQSIYGIFLALFFEFGVAFHGHGIQRDHSLPPEEKYIADKKLVFKIWKQLSKDYVFFPLLSGFQAPRVFLGNLASNLIRNLWTFSIIFCGHFTKDSVLYPESTLEGETRGQWYLRQLHGSGNLEGGELFDTLSGNLSHQIEHHLFPDIPANRYAEVGLKVKEIAKRYGQSYNTGSFWGQFSDVAKRIFAFSLPDILARNIYEEVTVQKV